MFQLFKPKKYLGIDIGTSSIKLVELKEEGGKIILNTYGELKISESDADNKLKMDILHMSDKQLADMLRQLIIATKASAKDAIFSIPVFSSFITLMDLPVMSDKELQESIPFEAKKYIPVPINEVQFSWSIIEKPAGKIDSSKNKNPQGSSAINPSGPLSSVGLVGKMQILIVAVPNEIMAKYKNIAKLAGLNAGFEIETFSIARSLVKGGVDSSGVVAIVDVGAKSTEICVVDNGLLRMSHNFETSGINITKALSQSLNLNFDQAEEFKTKKGIKLFASEKSAMDSILPLIDMIIFEIERININYQQRSGKRVQKIILSGGTANLPGLVDYVSNHMGLAVSVADPFSRISSSPVLGQILRDAGPTFSVAVGLAERNLV